MLLAKQQHVQTDERCPLSYSRTVGEESAETKY